jgi:hypothetical protein
VARFYEAFDSARRHSHETSGERAKMRPEKYVLRWAALQMGVASFGMLRPPVMVNRHRSKHVPWDDFPRVGEGVNKSVSAREEQPEARFGA